MDDDSRTPRTSYRHVANAFYRQLESVGLASSGGDSQGSGAQGITKAADAGDALAKQIGGDHYKSLAIQPIEYIHANGLDYLAGNVVKYVTRHKSKSGAADVRKAIHYLQLILKLQYGVDE